MSSVVAWELEEGATSSTDDVFLPGAPGVWREGVPRTADELGTTVTEFREFVKEHDLPLREVKAKPVDADALLERTGGILSGATHGSAPESGLRRDASDVPGLTEDELAEREAFDASTRPAALADELPEGAPTSTGDAPRPEGEGHAKSGGAGAGSSAGSASASTGAGTGAGTPGAGSAAASAAAGSSGGASGTSGGSA